MKITKVECFALLIPDFDVDACSSAQDNLIVKIHTDDGLLMEVLTFLFLKLYHFLFFPFYYIIKQIHSFLT